MYINSTQLENYTKGNSTGNHIFLYHLNIASVKRYKSRCTCSPPGLHFWHWTTLPTNHINLCNSNSNVKGCAALSASTSTVPYTQVNRCRKSTQINYIQTWLPLHLEIHNVLITLIHTLSDGTTQLSTQCVSQWLIQIIDWLQLVKTADISAVKLDVPSWVQKGHKGHTDTHDNYKKPKKPIAISHTNKEKAL